MQHTLERNTVTPMSRSASLRLSGLLKNLQRTRHPSTVQVPNRKCWCWWSQPESNRRPPACKAGALPSELWPLRLPIMLKACRHRICLHPIRQCPAITLLHRAIGSPFLVGLGRFELPTSPLSGVRSNRLSYRPAKTIRRSQVNCVGAYEVASFQRHDKEVIQPQVPLRLPCYDFTPVMNHTVVSALPKVKQPTSGTAHSHGMTGGVYKARERIHRSVLICDY